MARATKMYIKMSIDLRLREPFKGNVTTDS